MEGYGQFCPLSKAAEVLTERWTLLVLREVLLGSSRFNEIRHGVPLMSSGLLAQRLETLAQVGLIDRRKRAGPGYTYHATAATEELRPLLEGLSAWGHRWFRTDYRDEHLDASLLMWDIRRYVQPAAFGEPRVVVSFEFPAGHGQRRFWMVSGAEEADLCMNDPGFPVDIEVVADLRALTRVWLGDLTLSGAIRTGSVRVSGARPLMRRFQKWLGRHPVAGIPQGTRPRTAAAV